MPKRLIKRYMPDPSVIREHKTLRFLGERIHNPNLWHLNRRSVANAFAVGLFTAFIPLPGQMLIAAFLALYFSANLPISAALVWTSNPLTMGPLIFAAYITGCYVLQIPPQEGAFHFSFEGIMQGLSNSWKPVLLGCFIIGTFSSALGYLFVRVTWRLFVAKKWSLRKFRRPVSH